MKAKRRRAITGARPMGAPFLRQVVSLPESWDATRYPFDIRAFSRGIDLTFRTNVTFIVGENGSGKSTLLEALAECCGFDPQGGSRDHQREALAGRSEFAQALRLSWLPKVAGLHDTLSDHPQLSGSGPLQPGRRFDPGGGLSRDGTLPNHS
jgi:hypothetical protein